MSKEPVTMVLVGAGNRGRGVYGRYALDMPHRARFVAVAEPDDAKRQAFAEAHGIPANRCYASPAEMLAQKRLAEACVIATWENVRLEPTLAAMKAGYQVLVEKPLATCIEDSIRMTDAAAAFNGLCIVCHQMRHMPHFETVKNLVESGRYGDVVAVQHSENLSFSHMAHSFVRGFFNNQRLSPMLLSKSCHDMDMLCYLIGRRPLRVSSFGSLTWFKPENAPQGAPEHCLDGCPAAETCPYHVLKLYFGDDADQPAIRQMGVVRDKHHLLQLLSSNRWGRCAFRCDNDVVDHQVVQIEFEGGVTAGFSMVGHNYFERRITKISLTNGEIEYDTSKPGIGVHSFSPQVTGTMEPHGSGGSHGGGDRRIMDAFVDAIRTGTQSRVLTAVRESFPSHLLCFAAEEARRSGQVVDLGEYERQVRSRMREAVAV